MTRDSRLPAVARRAKEGHATPFIIDAHLHLGTSGMCFAPGCDLEHLLVLMDELQIEYAVCSEMKAVLCGSRVGMQSSYDLFEQSNGRVFFQGVYDPRKPEASLDVLEEAATRPGFVGLKIHPSLHSTPAESSAYEAAWAFADEHQCTILAHTWSVSAHNPVQALSTPERFEAHIKDFPGVHLVLGHAGGRGDGRAEAVRLANEYPNVYMDFAGDIYCYSFFQTMLIAVPVERILYGSDYPMLDPRTNLSRVLLGDMDEDVKLKILRENAIAAYGLGERLTANGR